VGDSTRNIQAFRHQGQLAGIDIGVLDQALERSTSRLAEFHATGSGPAAKWVEILGLDVQRLMALSPTERFQEMAEAVRGLSDRGQQLAATYALTGDSSRAMMRMVDDGRAGFEAAR